MRLGLRLLDFGAELNNFKEIDGSLTIMQGEDQELFVRLVDESKNGLRYIPASGATLSVTFPRQDEAYENFSTTERDIINYTLTLPAINPFPEDKSIWKVTLSATQTSNLSSSNILATLTEGPSIKKAIIDQAISMQGTDQC